MFFAPRYGEVIGDLYPYMQVPNRTSLSESYNMHTRNNIGARKPVQLVGWIL